MSAGTAFAIIVGVATFVGVGLALYYGRRESQKTKLLIYTADVVPIPLASTRSLAEYKLLLLHEPKKGTIKRIEDAYVHHVRFANFGREPIRRADLAPANPLRVEVVGAPVLEASIEAVRREVSQIALGQAEVHDDTTRVLIEFDFLDHLDGALIRVMTDKRPESISLVGDIVGMPAGLRRPADLEGRRKQWLDRVGFVLIVLFEFSALALTPLVYRWVTGSWADVWLLLLPVIALVLPLAISAFVGATIWPKARVVFPKELRPRRWIFAPWGQLAPPDLVDARRMLRVSEDHWTELPPGDPQT